MPSSLVVVNFQLPAGTLSFVRAMMPKCSPPSFASVIS
jgi:hypothetical protein